MANARPPGGTPQARLGIDLSSFQQAPAAARAAGQATAREISNAFKVLQAEQRLAQTQAQQTLAVLRGQQAQITATTRAESQVRIQQARAESIAQQQAARTASQVAIQEERRKTAAFNAELRQRRATASSFGQGAATFAGAALGGPIGGIAGALAGGGPALAAALAAGLAAREATRIAATSIQAASNLTESINKVTVAFAQSDQEMLDWSKTSASALGQSRQEALEAASSFGLLFSTIGLAPQEAAKMSRALVELAADMASINNIAPEEALIKLRAGLVGEAEPLRRVGVLLSAAAVEAKAMEMGLAASTGAITEQDKVMARYQLILEQTALTQGDFARTSGEAANLQRILTAEIGDFNAALGETLLPAYVIGLQGAAIAVRMLGGALSAEQRKVELWAQAWSQVALAINQIRGTQPMLPTVPSGVGFGGGAFGGGGTVSGFGGGGGAGGFGGGSSADLAAEEAARKAQSEIIADRYTALQRISRDADRAIVESAAQFARQRSNTIASYEKSIAREAEDFGRQRLNAERKLGMSILDVHQDSARQRVRWEADLARTLEEQRVERDERIAESRADSAERLADIEKKHNQDREKRQREFVKNIREAAANLNAVQVRELLTQRRDENKEAKESRAEQIADEAKSLQKRIDDANKSYAKQETQQRAALDRRIQQQAEDDRLRIQEMKDAFAEQQAQEDIERGIKLARQAEDHAAQLLEMDRAQGERIQQIKDQEAESLAEQERAYDLRLQAEGVHNAKLEAEQRRHQVIAEASYAEHLARLDAIVKGQVQGPLASPWAGPVFSGPGGNTPIASSVSNSRNVNITINVPGGTSLGAQQLYDVAYQAANDALADTLEAYQQ